jgi:hypothetical protein
MTAALADIQARFGAFVVEDAAAPLDLVRSGAHADAETMLSVYREGYRLRLLEALGEDYPALKRLLGEDDFDRMGRAYIARVRSRHYSIRWFGGRLAAFLEGDSNWRARPEVASLARWEWALGEAADAADAPALGRETLTTIPAECWGEARFAFHPSLRRLDLAWTAPAYRQAIDSKDPALPLLQPLSAPIAWAIWRDGTSVLYRSLAAAEAAALDFARGGATFGRLCETLADSQGDRAAATAASFLGMWVGAGWIVGIEA